MAARRVATASSKTSRAGRPNARRRAPRAWIGPGFRGPAGLGISDATDLPLEWDQAKNIAWKTALPGPGASSPIVCGDRVYITCYTGYFIPDQPGGSLDELQRHLIALRLDRRPDPVGQVRRGQAAGGEQDSRARLRGQLGRR